MTEWVKSLEISHDEAEHEQGLTVGSHVNRWGPKLAEMCINRGINPAIFGPGSRDVELVWLTSRDAVIVRDLT